LYFFRYYLAGVRRVAVHGIKDILISQLRWMGFNVIAIVDEEHEGKRLNGQTILNPGLVSLIKPDALFISRLNVILYPSSSAPKEAH
jgi:hypothetical protein